MAEIKELVQEVEQLTQAMIVFRDRCKKLADGTPTTEELYNLSSAAAKLSISLPEAFAYIAQGLEEAAQMAFWEELAEDEKPDPEPSVKLTRGGLKSERSG